MLPKAPSIHMLNLMNIIILIYSLMSGVLLANP